jgi:hypothetical protein
LTDITIQTIPCNQGLGATVDMTDVFVARWGGTVDGCKTSGDRIQTFIETYDNFMSRNTYDSDSSDMEHCTPIAPVPAIDQVNPFGKYICGTRSQTNFANAIRPKMTGECEEGYEICS